MQAANDNGSLRFLSVCSGIEAASTAWGPLGWKAAAFSEIEKFPSAVLAHHYPDVPNLGDFTKIETTALGHIDILCGGTPCQAFSVAGLRNSLADARGNLSLEFVRLAHELAGISEAPSGSVRGPAAGNGLRNVVWENVPGVLSTKDNAFGCFLGALVGADDALPPPAGRKWPDAGMVDGPKGRAAWRTLDAQYFGLAQRRRRVILVADFGNGADPAAVLFELEGVLGNPAPSREARQDVAPTISARTKGGGGLGTDFDLDGGLVEAANQNGYAPEIARCVATREGSSQDYETTTMVAVEVAPTLRAGGNQTGGDRPYGTDVDTADSLATVYSIMPQNSGKDYKAREVEIAQPLMAAGPVGGNQGGDFVLEPVCVTAPVTHTLKADGFDASEDGTGRGQPIVAFDTTQITSATNRSNPKAGDPCHPLSAQAHPPAIAATSAVRRLTPRECERLQGFPDDYTLIPWRGKAAEQCPDGPRYKALGNSWAVPKFVWLGKRIAALMPQRVANDNLQQREAA